MGFDIVQLAPRSRINQGMVCSVDSCGCATCPVRAFCDGPNGRCDAKKCDRVCGGCRAVCNRNPDRQAVVDALGGADFSAVRWQPFDADLPPIIHQISSPVPGIELSVAVINVKKLFSLKTHTWSPTRDLRERFGLSPQCKVIISFFTGDQYMDVFQDRISEVAGALRRYDVDYVLSMDFSNYDNYPRFDTIVNLRRRMVSVELLQDHGFKVIPTLGWCADRDFIRMRDWCVSNATSIVALNVQTIRAPTTNSGWTDRLTKFRELRSALPTAHLLFVGAAAPARIRTLYEAVGPPIHFLDAKSYRTAEFHKDVEGARHDDIAVRDLFLLNAAAVNAAYTAAANATGHAPVARFRQPKLPLG